MGVSEKKAMDMAKSENVVAFPDLSRVEAQATEWIMLFEDGGGTPEERAAFKRWLDESVHHRDAYMRFAALWDGMERFEELSDYSAADDGATLLKGSRYFPRSLGRRSLMRIAASLFLVVAAAVAYQALSVGDLRHVASHETVVGAHRTVSLPDGSRIDLNTNSRMEIDYSLTSRRVRLVRGEAYFDVVENQSRPFVVEAGGGAVRAVGTAFSVRLRDRKIDVTVTEGQVALFASAPDRAERVEGGDRAAPAALLRVAAGQQVVFEDDVEQLNHVAADVMKRKLSWRDGMLAFSGEPLSEMVAEVSRYTDMTIEIEDDELRVFPVAGYFKAGDVEAMLEAFELAGGLRVERLGPKHVRLTKGEAR